MDRRLPVGLIVCLQAMASACGSRTPPVATPGPETSQPPLSEPTPPPPKGAEGRSECALIGEPGEPVAVVALGDRIDPAHAPHPTNEGERLLFRQLYETLIRVDCHGRAAPGLAASWRPDADGRAWIVTLREHARFSDGAPVTAADVLAGWSRDGSGGELSRHVSRLVHSAVPLDDRTLAITLHGPRADAPLALAHADLAVAKRVDAAPWPLGTRASRIALEAGGSGATGSSVVTLERHNLPSVRFLAGAGDPRDLLDEGVDLLLTRDPAALGYAATLPQFQSVPLAWGRTHVFLSPGRTRASPAPPDEARQALADDAVRGEARGSQGPFWWEMSPGCGVAPPPPVDRSAPGPRIVYDARDGAARDLAERLVGLLRADGPGAIAFLDALLPDRSRRTSLRAIGLAGDEFARARRLGTDTGYIVSLDSRPLEPCRDLQVLIDASPWVDPGTIVPLVDTRLQAIVRRGRSGLTAEWDGGVSLGHARDER